MNKDKVCVYNGLTLNEYMLLKETNLSSNQALFKEATLASRVCANIKCQKIESKEHPFQVSLCDYMQSLTTLCHMLTARKIESL